MSSSSSNSPWTGILLIGCVVILIMWLFDAGPFEKSYEPTSTYSNSTPYSHGSNVSFGASHKNGSYTVSAYFRDGSYACKVTVKDGMAYPNGSSQGANIYNAEYGAPGAYYCFWSSSMIFF